MLSVVIAGVWGGKKGVRERWMERKRVWGEEKRSEKGKWWKEGEGVRKKVRGWIPPLVYHCWTVWPAGWMAQWKADGWKSACVYLSRQPNRAMERDRAMNSLAVVVFVCLCVCVCVCWQKRWLYWQLAYCGGAEALDKSPGPPPPARLFMWHRTLILTPPHPALCLCVFVCVFVCNGQTEVARGWERWIIRGVRREMKNKACSGEISHNSTAWSSFKVITLQQMLCGLSLLWIIQHNIIRTCKILHLLF